MIKLLSRGPKFVPGQKCTVRTVRNAEVAVERFAFGHRWQTAIEERTEQGTAQQVEEMAQGTPREQYKPEGKEQVRPCNTTLDNDITLRKLCGTTRQPPLMGKEDERKLRRMKDDIMSLYDEEAKRNRKQSTFVPLSQEEKDEIQQLRGKHSVVIKPSDKGKGFVLLPSTQYDEKAEAMLDQEADYEKVAMTVDKLDEETSRFVDTHLKNKLPEKLEKAIKPRHSRMPRFYGLPKDHKAGLPLRPVVSSCDSPTSNLSLIVERILNQLLMFVPAHLDSTEACIEDIKRHRQVPDGCIIASFDVVGLYSNIPIDESISAAITKLEQHKDDVDMLGLTVADVQLMLQYVLSNNYFEFNSKQYRQKRGIAMGNHLAPPLAILFMDALEQKALSTATVKPDLYKRYIDDCILLWRHGWKGLAALLDHFNGQHTTIKFTMEHSVNETQSVNFLDLALSVRGNSIEWELYVKPSHSGVHLSYESCLPWSCKRAVATNQFSRAIRNSSTPEAEDRSMSIIEELLERNDYPRTEINAARRAAKGKRQDTHPSQQQQRDRW
ncbi:uncharacterized protein LOC135805071 [Sycon ciliatum]|uniref:uncharacterized protein LOC135805071 n=1 Tax=Sycon ciliatum TaxID=27933 RepID=UPI0031F717F5